MIYKCQQAYYDSLTISNMAVEATVFIKFMLDAIFEILEAHSLANSLILSEQNMSEKEQAVFEKVSQF